MQYLCGVHNKRVGGIVVSIAAFQAVDPGSIPGRRIVLVTFLISLKREKVLSYLFKLSDKLNR